ncbi:tRNA (guanine(46)-N(7))-methyltransferase TrmB, partial [Vibrio campbellii]
EVFANMIPESSLSTLQLFFPDPWHKKRHHKRRIVQLDFAEMVRTKLIPEQGIFHMATDWENYGEHMIEVMNEAPGFANIATDGDFVPRPDDRPLTK